MRVYPSDEKDWNAELRAAGKAHIKPSHPYELEDTEDLLFVFWPVGWFLRILMEIFLVLL